MSRSRSGVFPFSSSASSSLDAAVPGSIFPAKGIPTSNNEAAEAEANKGTSARKIGSLGNKIRIRLPPRKRLAEGDEAMRSPRTVVPEDTKDQLAKEVSEHADNNTPGTVFMDNKLKGEEVFNKAPREANCQEAESNSLIKAMSKDALPEQANLTVWSPNLTTAPEAHVREEISYPVRRELCEEGNRNIMRQELPLEDTRNTPKKESVGAINNSPRKNLSVIKVHCQVEKNDSCNIIPTKSLLYGKNSNSSGKGLFEEAKITNPKKLLTTSAVKGEEANDNSVGNNLFEEARKNIGTARLSTEAINCAPSRRPTNLTNDKKSSKKLRTSVEQATGTSHNISGIKLATSAGLAVEQSTGATFLEAAKEYEEFEEKVKRTVYLDNLSPLAKEAVIRMALNQFGNVRNVSFLTNYTVPFDIPQSAFVEMETEKDAESVVSMLDEFPFMILGMPRPVRAKRATPEMFNDRPWKPGRKLKFCWVSPTDPDLQDVRKFKLMSKRHEVENLALIRNQLQEEALLAKHQQDNLNCNYRKLETLDSVIQTGWVNHLSHIYSLNFDKVY